ncbi:MAG: HU family DNA-binding protein [Actinocatenispora sp.]
MNKAELIEALTVRLGDRKMATAALEAVLDEIQRTVGKGGKISLAGFGVFEKRARAARTARNPRTGEAVKVKKTSVPAFRPGQGFKDVVTGKKKIAAAKKTAAKKTATKVATAKTAAKKTTAKSAAKPAATKKATTRPAAAKSTAKKTVAKKAPAKTTTKSAAKKTVAKKAPAKTAKRTTARKTATKSAAKRAPRKR